MDDITHPRGARRARARQLLHAYCEYRRWNGIRLGGVHLLAALGAGFCLMLPVRSTPSPDLLAAARAAVVVIALVVLVAGVLERRWHRELRRDDDTV